jgi:hypothetical protein
VTTNKVLDTEQALTLVLPLPLNIANSRLHWAVKNKKKQRYFEELSLRKDARLIPRPTYSYPRRVRVDVTLFVWSKLDRDNAYSRCKWPLDWLVGNGYLAEDCEDRIELVVTQKVDRKNQRMQVTITPMEAAQ